ncbi:amidohydrolase family protein [Nonomuraea sp. NPDC003727]
MHDDRAHDGAATRREFLGWLSKAGVLVAGAGAATASWPAPAGAATGGQGAGITVLRDATVIDGLGGPPLREATVVLTGDRIAWVGRRTGAPVPAGARSVDLRGKYVIPGLWEMHAHTELDKLDLHLPLYLANGVTGIREMWGTPDRHDLRRRLEAGDLAGPRMVLAGNILDGPESFLGAFPIRTVTSEADAHEAVRETRRDGADLVKVYSLLPRHLYAAIADEAGRQGLPFAGHLSDHVSLWEAAELGQRSVEHLFGTFFATSRDEAAFRRLIGGTPVGAKGGPYPWFVWVRELERQAVATYDARRAGRLFARLAERDTWQTPTLAASRVSASPAGTFRGDWRLKYLPRGTEEYWEGDLGAPATPEEIASQREYFQARLRVVGEMRRAGVGILAGTDSNQPYVFPGFGLHDELGLLVEAGLTPMQALRSATADAARHLGWERDTGTVTAGKLADLVVLDADPLRDIGNTRRIHAVVSRGRLISAAEREGMLAAVEAAAKEHPPAGTTAAAGAMAGCC